ncbi:MAG: hypothetical protein ACD_19C00014G0052 [uncultured bacterium]|nr:MAG: hypothetical protein ACD_19C00014G0052 [uncultured bacterium]
MSSSWNQILSEFLVNIAAGWFGAIFIFPVYSKERQKFEITFMLVVNIILVVLCLSGAYYFR